MLQQLLLPMRDTSSQILPAGAEALRLFMLPRLFGCQAAATCQLCLKLAAANSSADVLWTQRCRAAAGCHSDCKLCEQCVP